MRLPISASDSPLAVDSPPKMNGELPNNVDTPITTLAGIFSLSDLLPELPLPAAQPETLNNRSLLFHPRVAEEAQRLLSVSSRALLPQLVDALQLTDTTDIELLKSSSIDTAAAVVSENTPQLLSALRQLNSQLFVDDAVNNGLPTAAATAVSPSIDEARNSTARIEPAECAVQPVQENSATPPSTDHHIQQQEAVSDVKPPETVPCKSSQPVMRDVMVVVKSDPENEALMQRALAEMQRRGQYSSVVKRERDECGSVAGGVDDDQLDSDSAEPDTTVKNKYFRAKQRQRDLLKQKEREERKRKRQEGTAGDDEADAVSEAKRLKHEAELLERIKTVRRYQRRSCDANDKLGSDELLEGNVITKFKQSLELILDGAEELDLNNNDDDDDEADVPQEALIPRYRLSELAAGAAQLRRLSLTHTLPPELLVRALALLELNVRDAVRVAPLSAANGSHDLSDDDNDEDADGGCRLWTDIGMERVIRGADASLVIMYVLTAPGMPKRVYLEDCIDRVVKFVKYQLENTIYPAFDPVYRAPSKKSSSTPSVGRGRKRAAAMSMSASSGVSVSSSGWARDKSVLALYNRLRELVAALAELLHIQVLTDTCVLQISSMGVAPFFVESISDLQLSALRLVTTVFSRYPKHRRLLLDDILASIARLPSSKRSLRTYRLSSLSSTVGGGGGGSSGEDHEVVYIQMLTALVLQLIQCVVTLPSYLAASASTSTTASASTDGAENQSGGADCKKEEDGDAEVEVDRDVLIVDRYDTAMRTAHSFLSVFLQKCGSRNEEVDYRPLFENFIQDLLAAVNRPEWPAAECLLSLLGTLLVSNFSNKSTDMALRVSSLDYLGVVAARLRRDAVQSTARPHLIDSIIAEVQREELRSAALNDTPTDTGGSAKKKDKKKKKKQESSGSSSAECGDPRWQHVDAEEQRTRVLQRVLLDYLGAAASDDEDQALLHCRHFYLAQWYREAPQEIRRACMPPRKPQTSTSSSTASNRRRSHQHKHQHRRKRRRRRSSACDSSSNDEESSSADNSESDGDGQEPGGSVEEQRRQTHVNLLVSERRQLLLTKVNVYGHPASLMSTSSDAGVRSVVTCIDYEHAELISKYLASKRPFSHSFDVYLKQIINVLSESAIAVRTKAMKCLTMVVEADPAVLARGDMQMGVHNSFLDHSTAVREAAVDLVGKFLLCRPELIDKYYSMLSARILDTGVSVRKRVIKIMKDICVECPSFSKIPEICVKMIRRINDEEGIRKLVMEVFQAMWFTPVKDTDGEDSALLVKVMNITDVVVACQDSGLDWFDQLLNTLFKPKEDKEDSTRLVSEPPRVLLQASAQIVDCLVRHILRLEETQPSASSTDTVSVSGSSQRLVACLSTLFLLARIRPTLLVQHATTLQPYLSVRCHTRADHLVISHVARTLQLVVPLIEHPSESFLAQLEEDCVKLILQHDRVVVESCIACLGSIVNRVTKNYSLVRDCFKKYYATMKRFREKHEEDADNPALIKCKPFFRRSLFTVGLLLRHFDFKHQQVHSDLGDTVVSDVYELLMYFLERPVTTGSGDLQYFTLQALGFVAVRHYELLLLPRTKQLYDRFLAGSAAAAAAGAGEDTALSAVTRQIRTQVLLNLEVYLVEEEQRMIKQDEDWSKRAQEENLKEMGDVTSGMASTVIQLYLGRVLESFLDSAVTVRHASLKVIQLILSQGLVHPVQIVPYLICMSTDPDERISHTADRQLQDIEKKYPGFIQMKASAGIRLSFQLQQIIQQKQPTRGLKCTENEPPAALNGYLYTLLRTTKQQRRAFAMSCLRNFDEHVKNSLTKLLYLADNLACFPYQVADEVLFIIHQVDVIVSVTGSTVLQCVREALLPPPGQVARYQPETGALLAYDDEDEEDVQQLLQRLPADSSSVRLSLQASEGCQLLLTLKQHLKEFYGVSDNKIAQYSPSEAGKVYEKSINRRSSAVFSPRGTVHVLRQRSELASGEEDAESDDARAKLVTQYLEFKQLMLHIDPADDEDEGETSVTVTAATTPLGVYRTRGAAAVTPSVPSPPPVEPARPPITLSLSALSKQAAAAAACDSSAEVETPRVPKLTIVPLRFSGDGESRSHHKHKHKKSDKHKKKKKKRKRHDSGGDDDDADSDAASDPDYTG